MIDQEIFDILNRTADQWDKTEELLKLAEVTTGEVVISAIMELRYAGRRLVDAFRVMQEPATAMTAARIRAFVLEVEQFCNRAQHDGIDSIIGYLGARLRFMERQFGIPLLFEHFPNYPVLNSTLDRLNEVSVASRGQRGKRAALYNGIQNDDLPGLIDQVQALDSSETALVALAQKSREEDDARIRETETNATVLRWTIGGVAVALVGVVVAIVIGVIGLLK